MSMTTIEHRLDNLESREAIREVLHRYCLAADRCDADMMRSCYHPDAHDDHSFYAGEAHGFVDYVVPQLAKLSASTHSISNPTIRLTGEQADVQCQWSVVHRLDGMTAATDLWHQGRYIDLFERRSGEWRIARRVVIYDCERWLRTADLQSLAKENSPERLLQGRRDRRDPGYDCERLRSASRRIAGPSHLWGSMQCALAIPVAVLHLLGTARRRLSRRQAR